MAKLKAGYVPGPNYRRVKRLHVTVDVQRISGSAGSFEACARFGRGDYSNRTKKSQDEREGCAIAKNPRKAIHKALSRVGANVANRRGAFAGVRRKR